MSAQEYNLIDYLTVLKRWKKFILLNVFVITLFAIILSLIIPKTYRASAVLMPPLTQTGMGVFTPLIDSPFGGLFSQTTDETMSMIAILKSRTVLTSVIEKFNLIELYEVENMDIAIQSLKDHVLIDIDDEGTIRVSVDILTKWFHPDSEEEKAKQLCSDIANYFIKQLDIVNKKLQTEQASFQRKFIEKRYNNNIQELKLAEEKLKQFQEINNLISLPEQTNAAIEAASKIKGHILANEVRLEVLKKAYNSGHPDIDQLKNEIAALTEQLHRMEYRKETEQTNIKNIFPPFSRMPELETQLRQFMREVEIQNTLLTFLTQQYEEAKINEAKDTPTIQVLDIAVKPNIKYKPFRALIVIGAGIFGLIFSFFISFVRERIDPRT
jgi:uncharacterized protein involved in exopolysaccharide biosynthesis